MQDAPENIIKNKQDNLSAALVIINICLALLYVICTPQREDDFFVGLLAVGIAAVLLQLLFVFVRKGKAPLLSKWLLAIFVLATVLYGGLIAYAMALGKAFQH